MSLQHRQANPGLLGLVTARKTQKAWVVFSGQADLKWLRLLKSGYRHCYVLINDGEHWVSIDPLSGHTEVTVHDLAPDFDLPAWLQARGMITIAAPITPQAKQAPPGLCSCVESVKRILGLHAPFILTPWQLYQKLRVIHQ